MSVGEVARELGVSRSYARYLVYRYGLGVPVRSGGREARVITRAELEQLRERRVSEQR